MSNCDKSTNYWIADYPICSGHGICVNGNCVCDIGWTGYIDLQRVHGYDCDVNLYGLRIISLIDMILGLLVLPAILYSLWVDDCLRKEKRFRAKTLCILAFLGLDVSGIIFSAFRFIYPGAIVGVSYISDTLTWVITVFAASGVSAYFYVIIKILKGYCQCFASDIRARVRSRLNTYFLAAYVTPIIGLVCYSTFVYTSHAFPDKHSDKFCIGISAMYTVIYVVQGIFLLQVLQIFLSELNNQKNSNLSTENSQSMQSSDPLHSIYSKVRTAYLSVGFFLISGAPLNSMFIFWYFIRRKVIFYFFAQLFILMQLSAVLPLSLIAERKVTPTLVNVRSNETNFKSSMRDTV